MILLNEDIIHVLQKFYINHASSFEYMFFFRTSPFLICLKSFIFLLYFFNSFQMWITCVVQTYFGDNMAKKKKTFFVRSKRGVGPPPHPPWILLQTYYTLKKRILKKIMYTLILLWHFSTHSKIHCTYWWKNNCICRWDSNLQSNIWWTHL